MSKNTLEFIKEEREKLKKKAFSKTVFIDLLATYSNDPEFTSHTMKGAGDDKAVKLLTKPARGFRNVFKKILVEFGAEEKDAVAFLAQYKFANRDLESVYDFMSDAIYQYLQIGRPLELFSKEDVVASIFLEEVEADEKEYETLIDFKDASKGKKKSKSKWDKHNKLKSKSSCPKWKKYGDDLTTTMEIALEQLFDD